MDWFRFYPNKYREKTLALDPYQDGCYRRLIDEYMTKEMPLPDNDAALARICGISLQDWLLHSASIVRALFKQKNGYLVNKTCEEELDFQDSQKKIRSNKAKNAAEKRWAITRALDATSMPVAMLGDARVESRELRDKNLDIINRKEEEPEKLEKIPAAAEEVFFNGENEKDLHPNSKFLLSTDWVIPDEWGEQMESLGFSAREIINEGKKFLIHWRREKAKFTISDWHKRWCNWFNICEERKNGIRRKK